MRAPYPDFIYDFTASRGIAMRLEPRTAKTLLFFLENDATSDNDLLSEVVKEIHFHHDYELVLPSLEDEPLEEAISKLSTNAAKGLYAALTRDNPVLHPQTVELLLSLGNIHGIEKMQDNEMRDALLVCSVIYTLPRMTAASGTVAEHVINIWRELASTTQDELRTIISDAIRAGRAGDEVDKRGWISVMDHADAVAATSKPGF